MSLQQAIEQDPPDNDRKYEILNAGVAGYSSYQGLKRFESEVERYQPNLVLVSFGWNYIAYAVGKPDKEFKPMLPVIQRKLFEYHSFWWMTSWLRTFSTPQEQTSTSRVPLEDYVENMGRFADVAGKHGARIIFLTRPYRMTREEIEALPSWRKQVPAYNDKLREFAEKNGHELVDVESLFRSQPPDAFIDECHFTRQGHDILGQILWEHIRP